MLMEFSASSIVVHSITLTMTGEYLISCFKIVNGDLISCCRIKNSVYFILLISCCSCLPGFDFIVDYLFIRLNLKVRCFGTLEIAGYIENPEQNLAYL